MCFQKLFRCYVYMLTFEKLCFRVDLQTQFLPATGTKGTVTNTFHFVDVLGQPRRTLAIGGWCARKITRSWVRTMFPRRMVLPALWISGLSADFCYLHQSGTSLSHTFTARQWGHCRMKLHFKREKSVTSEQESTKWWGNKQMSQFQLHVLSDTFHKATRCSISSV